MPTQHKDEAEAVVKQGEHINAQADATAALAKSAEVQSKAAAAQLELTRQSLEASVRPIIVDVHTENTPQNLTTWNRADNGNHELYIPVRNIGAGPAFIKEALVTAGPSRVYGARVFTRVVPPDEDTVILCTVTPSDPLYEVMEIAFSSNSAIATCVRYSDLNDRHNTQSNIYFYRSYQAGPRCEVQKVEFYGCDNVWLPAGGPFATTGDL